MNENLYSIQLEQSVLSTLLTVYAGVDDQIGKLTPDHFYAGQHNIIFKHIKKLHSSGDCHDIVVVWDSIKIDANDSKIVSEQFLMDLMADAPSAAYLVGQHTDKLIDYKRRRDLFNAGAMISTIAVDTTQFDTDTAVTRAESVLTNIEKDDGDNSLHDAYNLSIDLFQSINKRVEDRKNGNEDIGGVRTGFRDIDSKIGICGRGDLIIIAARPSMGKTALIQCMMIDISFTQQAPVIFHSAEMTKQKVSARLVSNIAEIQLKDMRDATIPDEKWGDFVKATDKLEKSKLFIDDTSNPSLSDVRKNCRRVRAKHGKVGAVFIDYLTLMKSPIKTDQNHLAVGEISKGLKAIAKEFDCPVFCLSQLNRGVENRADKRPMMSDLRESGQIEQDADAIMFIYRDDYYNENSKEAGITEIIAAKVRDGEVGTVRLATELQYSRFCDLDMDYYHQSLES